MKYELLVFDLDGTLAETSEDIALSLERVLERFNRPSVPRAQILAAIGRGVRTLIERVAQPPIDPILEAFMTEYGTHLMDHTRLYPGVAETLAALPMRKIVLSNKPEQLSRRMVEALGIADSFEAVYGGDSFPTRKPDADAFRRAVGSARPVLMIGDSGIDVQTAHNAGVQVCAVSYGYYHPGDLDSADFRIDRFSELLDLVR